MEWRWLSDAFGSKEPATLREVLDAVLFQLGLGGTSGRSAGETAFTVAVVALAGKLAKADGVVTRIEAQTFRQIFKASPEEAANVQRLFDLARQDVAGFEAYAKQLATMLAAEPQMKRDVLESLFQIAAADGVLHAAEEGFLKRVSEILAIDEVTWRAVRASFVHDANDPYVVLGIPHGASDAVVKKAWRDLVRAHHPDALAGRGVTGTFLEAAAQRVAAYNAAYEAIEAERKPKLL